LALIETRRELFVGYQGTEGAYSQLAAKRHFVGAAQSVRCVGYHSFREMLDALKAGDIDYAVLPIENSIAGSINESYDLLAKMDLFLAGEEFQPIEHCLIGAANVPVGEIRRIYSHPVALAQCRSFLETLEDCHVEAFVDTAMAVEKVKRDADPTQAAIASKEAAALHELPILRRDIADHPENYTRMVIVAAAPEHYQPGIPCKTSLIFSTIHEQGALARCITIFAKRGLNLTKIESRPKPDTPFEYIFYVDFEGNVDRETTQAALRELGEVTTFLKVLGSYPTRRPGVS
jgi:chorismate mutase/prephenate dehydratase